VNKKNQVTQKRLYSKEEKRGGELEIMKEVAGQLKSMEKLRQHREATNSSKFVPGFSGGGAEEAITR
jgi:hypothetical protein